MKRLIHIGLVAVIAWLLESNTFAYTQTGQLQSESFQSVTLSNAYTQGARTAITVGTSSTNLSFTYGYDSTWRLQSLNSPAGSFTYGYPASASTLVQSIALPNGANIVNGYDSLSRLTNTALQNVWGHVLDGYGYAYGRADYRTGITRSLGLTTNSVAAAYDNIGQLIKWTASETGGAPRANEQLGYGYDAAHNLAARTNNALIQNFTVDAFDELTNVTRSGTLTVSGATPAPATNVSVNGTSAQLYGDLTFAATNFSLADGANRFVIKATNVYSLAVTNTVLVNLPVNVALAYDTNGNLTGDGTRTFYYDAENRLTNVNVAGTWKTEFGYDGFGRRRIERDYTWNGSTWQITNETHYVFDGLVPIQERDSNNAVLVTYTRGWDFSGGINGAGGIGGLLARTDSSGSTFYHADGSGNVTALMDGMQNIVARYEYDPYGRMIGQWGKMAQANAMRFSSMLSFQNSCLIGYHARFYEPGFQRWLNRDPIGETGGVNSYGFVGNGPVVSADPWGQAPEWDNTWPSWMDANGNPRNDPAPNAGLPKPEQRDPVDTLPDVPTASSFVDMRPDWTGNRSFTQFGKHLVKEAGMDALDDATWFVPGLGEEKAAVKAVRIGEKEAAKLVGEASKLKKAELCAEAAAKGRVGERAAGIVKNTKHIDSLTGTAEYRIPDVLDEANKLVGEVKNVEYLAFTRQLQDDVAYAKKFGYTFELTVRLGDETTLSKKLLEAVERGDIILRKKSLK